MRRAWIRSRAICGGIRCDPRRLRLSKPFVDENFNFFSATLNGQKEQTPRWKRCTRATDAALGEAVGQDWVKQNFPPDAKANMDKLVAALERALGRGHRRSCPG